MSGPPERPRRIERVAERVLRFGPIAGGRAVLARYDRAGGGLLASGLAYAALFALLPSLLLVVGVTGIVVSDPQRRASLVDSLAAQVPPLSEFFRVSVSAMADGSGAFSLLGLVGLLWGASRFFGSLDDAFARVFEEKKPRGFVERMVLGLLSVGGLILAFLLALALTAIASLLENSLDAAQNGTREISRLVSPALAATFVTVALAILYRVVPTPAPRWRSIWLPALLVGIVLGLLTDLFAYLAPRLVGVAALYGGFVAGFAALIWLGLVFQGILLGGAWVCQRDHRYGHPMDAGGTTAPVPPPDPNHETEARSAQGAVTD